MMRKAQCAECAVRCRCTLYRGGVIGPQSVMCEEMQRVVDAIRALQDELDRIQREARGE